MATATIRSHPALAAGLSTKASPEAATSGKITLKGSVDIVTEFFGYSINSILYQRGIYPPESFNRVKKYGLTMLMTNEDGLREYLKSVLKQVREWLMSKHVQRLVVVVSSSDTAQVLERWQFDIECEQHGENVNDNTAAGSKVEKTEKEIHTEIAAIIRQITASVTFLPLLEGPCTFDLLIYTDKDVQTPSAWEESDPKYIANSQEVRLRSFTTSVHKVDTMVAYLADE